MTLRPILWDSLLLSAFDKFCIFFIKIKKDRIKIGILLSYSVLLPERFFLEN